MYNEEVKSRFLLTLPTDTQRANFMSVFGRTESIEAGADKDISNFSRDECADALFRLKPVSVKHIESLKSQLNKYARWAKENSVTDRNWWELVSIEERYARHAFASRHVKNISELESLVEAGLSTPYDKYVIYLLYAGLMGEQFSELANIVEKCDVDKVRRTITTSRRIHTNIPLPLWELIDTPGEYTEAKPRDEDSIYLIKPFRTKGMECQPVGHQYVYRVFQKWINNLNDAGINDKSPTPTSIWHSGMYYSAYQIEQSKGGGITNHDYQAIKGVYGYEVQFSSFLREYELYKEVFWYG